MALQRFEDASKTALIIAEEEQNLGNYRNAHDILLKNYLALRGAQLNIPQELDSMLMILHSYLVVKVLFTIYS